MRNTVRTYRLLFVMSVLALLSLGGRFAVAAELTEHENRSDVTTQTRDKLIKVVPPVPEPKPVQLNAVLVDVESKAHHRSATVEVDVGGLQLTDPARSGEAAMPNQGHIHYKVDNGPVIATTANKLSFHGLTKGKHTIQVDLVGNDHKPLGYKQSLSLTVP